MTDDIVTRLREMFGDDDRCIWCGKHMDSESGPHRDPCDLMEAADEIERLRAEVNLWMGAAEKFAESEAMSYYLKLKEDEHGKQPT